MKAPTALMAGKRGLILGVANDHSIAWGIAKTLSAHGATLAFTYQVEAFAKRVRPLAESIGSDLLIPCDVSNPENVDATIATIKDAWGELDFLVHAIAFSDRAELNGRFLDTSRENFARTLDISCFSFTALARAAAPLMTDGGSFLTLTYDGSQRVMPNYNVMGVAKAALEASTRYLAADLGPDGIRVNAISAGPMRTLAGAAIGNARFVYKWQGENAPLRRNVSQEDVGGAALYLLSDLGSGTTGDVLYVDSGYNIIGMAAGD
ncbi:MAG: SDR family oxidoreductase [Alphaproteobacteria bacterium]|jgi:enoyl-[acyl-carrier protein] reductase I|nr:SDR family oxidoreductase [Alphaproteobacteria bacterium]|tara:strand:- start:74 stop:865 length:792 start_codon:yes stop_codon:yes gene_type:complete